KAAKGRAGIGAARPLADHCMGSQFRAKSIARSDDLCRRKTERIDEGSPMPIADAEDEVNVLLQRRMLELCEGGLIRCITRPIDHPRRYPAEQERIVGTEGDDNVPGRGSVVREKLMIVAVRRLSCWRG